MEDCVLLVTKYINLFIFFQNWLIPSPSHFSSFVNVTECSSSLVFACHEQKRCLSYTFFLSMCSMKRELIYSTFFITKLGYLSA